MASRKGCSLIAETLQRQGVEAFFYLIGGPMTDMTKECVARGLRGIDTRDERAAAFAAQAYARLALKPGVVVSCSGPGTTNVVTGAAHAYANCTPILALGGASPMRELGMGAFQEADQVGIMRPVTKLALQVQSTKRVPALVSQGLRACMAGRPGPVYLDFPADILYGLVEEEAISIPALAIGGEGESRAQAAPALVERALALMKRSCRPLLLVGSGVLWSQAGDALRAFMEASGIPLFTTPLARGVVPEDHPLCPIAARSRAFREADCLIVVGTRSNYVVNFLQPPVFSPEARVIEVNIDPEEIGKNRGVDVALVGDARMVLGQLAEAAPRVLEEGQFTPWVQELQKAHAESLARQQPYRESNETPIHPLRLCAEVQAVLPRDAVLSVDGHVILGFARQSIPCYSPGHWLNPGPFGTMGVGVPFGLGAKVARPESLIMVLTGDGAFGFHAMEFETAMRHRLGIVVVIANNGGWAGTRNVPGYELGLNDYHKVAEAFGGWGVRVERPDEIAPALRRAIEVATTERRPAAVNVIMATAKFSGRRFSEYET